MKIFTFKIRIDLLVVLIFLVLFTLSNMGALGDIEKFSSSLKIKEIPTSSFTIEKVSISTPKPQFNTNKLRLELANVPEEVKQGKPALSAGWLFGSLPGAPQLPMRSYRILLPPNADPASVKMNLIKDTPIRLAGEYYYAPAPFPIALTAEGEFVSRTTDMSYLYQEDALYPSETIQFFTVEQMRDAVLARFSYYPIQYNPVRCEVIEHRNAQVSISWRVREKTQVDPLTLKFLNNIGETIDNLAEMLPLYKSRVVTATGSLPSQIGSSYVIVTTNTIEANSQKLDDFVRYKQALGFMVQVITEDDYGSATGKQRALNIRSWLQNHYVSDSIEYVLLVGSPDPDEEDTSDSYGDVPMLMCWPRRPASSYKESPTDYFYADLTGNWDSDSDSYYGEYGEDTGVDFAAEVYVGRIPVYNAAYSTLDTILQGIIDHHVNAGSEKTKVLLPMAISNYANEDNSGSSRTDGLDCPEDVWNNILSPIGGMTDTVMYERSGLDPVPITAFHYDMPLNNSNVIDEMNNGHGAVFWWGHGNSGGAYRKYWSSDDGDSVPEAAEMTSAAFLRSTDMFLLETDQPCFTYQSSCTNGYPEGTNNLGYALLNRGAAVSTVSASRVSWYAVGTWSSSFPGLYSDNTGLGYYYMRNLLRYNQPAGAALFSAKSSGGTAWGGSSWMNKMDFNLYGDPHLDYWGSNQPNTPTNPSPSDGAFIGTSGVTLSVDVSDPDGDTLTVAFYNATDDSLIDIDTGVMSGGTASVTWFGFSPSQTYSWYVIVGDDQVTRQSSTWSFTVITDTTDPTWDEIPTNQLVEYNALFRYDLNASDNTGIDHYSIDDTTNFNIDADGVITNATKLDLGDYWVEVRAYDQFTNNCSATFKITVQDTTAPIWLQTPTNQTLEYPGDFSYDTTASDSHSIDHYWINDTVHFNIDADGIVTNATKLDLGDYWVEIRAYDASTNYCSATFKITIQDTTDPTWDQILTHQTVDYGVPFVYDVSASDLCGIDHYWINDTIFFNINNAGVITNATKLDVGVYWLEVRACDPSDNYCSAELKITVQELTPEPSSSSTTSSGTVTPTRTPIGLLPVLSAAFIIALVYYRRRTRKRLI